jgi:hypothetical protein
MQLIIALEQTFERSLTIQFTVSSFDKGNVDRIEERNGTIELSIIKQVG